MLRQRAEYLWLKHGLSEFVSEFIARWPWRRCKMLAINRPVDMVAEGIDIALVTASGALADSTLHYKITYSGRYFSCQFAVAGPPSWVGREAILTASTGSFA